MKTETIIEQLDEIRTSLEYAIGDTDPYMEDDDIAQEAIQEAIQEEYPVLWAFIKCNELIKDLECEER